MSDQLHELMQRVESEIGNTTDDIRRAEENCERLEQRRNLLISRRDTTTLSEKLLGVRLYDAAEEGKKAAEADERRIEVRSDLLRAKERLRELDDLRRLLQAEYDRRQYHINLLCRGV